MSWTLAWLAMRVVLVFGLLLLAGCARPTEPTRPTEPSGIEPADDLGDHATPRTLCAGHRHATFAVAMPDADGELLRLDVAQPRDDTGRPYYQLGVNPKMDVAMHMHLEGAEAGAPELAPSQLHMEQDGCSTVAVALATLDVQVNATQLAVEGRHARAGTWTAADGQGVHVYLQRPGTGSRGCGWMWGEVDAGAGLEHAIANGESFLVLFGDPTPANVTALQDGIPSSWLRPEASC